MLEHDFQDHLGYWICNTARQFDRVIARELQPQGITFRQCQVLAWLALEGELSQADLADRMNIEPPTVVRVLDRMERAGLIARVACSGDRRKKLIRPLPQAKPLWGKITAAAERVRRQAAAGLTTEQMQTLKKLLTVVHANLADRISGRAASVPTSKARQRSGSRVPLPRRTPKLAEKKS